MSIYIAGPMTGIKDYNYPAFDDAERSLMANGHEVLNPASNDEQFNPYGKEMPWDWYLRHAIRMLTKASSMAMLPGWEMSKGAMLEHNIGSALSLDIRELAGWL